MRVQTHEEKIHADIFYNFTLERGERVELWAIEKPPSTWDGPPEVFRGAYVLEQDVTSRINHMVKTAKELNDNAAYNMLQWFVEE